MGIKNLYSNLKTDNKFKFSDFELSSPHQRGNEDHNLKLLEHA